MIVQWFQYQNNNDKTNFTQSNLNCQNRIIFLIFKFNKQTQLIFSQKYMSQREKNHSNPIKKHSQLSQNSRYSFFQENSSDQEQLPKIKPQPNRKSPPPGINIHPPNQNDQNHENNNVQEPAIQSVKKLRSPRKSQKQYKILTQSENSSDDQNSFSFIPSEINQGQRLKYSLLYFRCQNFKSHLGLSHKLRIKDPTAIIGLNGAGKSNLVDAIGFAFGMAPQSIRAISGFKNIMSNALLHLTQFHARKIIQRFIFEGCVKSQKKKSAKICCYSNEFDNEDGNDQDKDQIAGEYVFNFNQIANPKIFFKIPPNLEQIDNPRTFVQISMEKRLRQNDSEDREQQENKFAYIDNKLTIRRQFEAVLKKDELQKLLRMIQQAQNSKQFLEKNLANIDKFILFEQHFYIYPSSDKIQPMYQLPKLEYIEFLRSQLNLQPEVKNFIIMQDDISPHKFTLDHHSQIIQKISGAQCYKKQREKLAKQKQEASYSLLELQNKIANCEKDLRMLQMQGKENSQLDNLKRDVQATKFQLLTVQLYLKDIDLNSKSKILSKLHKNLSQNRKSFRVESQKQVQIQQQEVEVQDKLKEIETKLTSIYKIIINQKSESKKETQKIQDQIDSMTNHIQRKERELEKYDENMKSQKDEYNRLKKLIDDGKNQLFKLYQQNPNYQKAILAYKEVQISYEERNLSSKQARKTRQKHMDQIQDQIKMQDQLIEACNKKENSLDMQLEVISLEQESLKSKTEQFQKLLKCLQKEKDVKISIQQKKQYYENQILLQEH